MEFKVFQMNEYEWVVAKDMNSAIEWYEKQFGEEIDRNEVRECDLEKEGQWVEFDDEDYIKELEAIGLVESTVKVEGSPNKKGFGSLLKMGGQWWIKVPFKDVLPADDNTEPFVTASTEW